MKNTQYTRLAIRLAVFYFITAGVCQSIQAQSQIPFRQIHHGVVVVSMMADKEGPFDFVLDTGADTTIVDPRLATRLALVAQGRVQQTTLAGSQALTRSVMATLAAGPAQVDNLAVLIQDLAMLRKTDPHIEGIAGQDFLSHFNYLLDYRSHSIRIEQDNEIRGAIDGDPVPIDVGGSRAIVGSEAQSISHAKLRLLLDSGADFVVLLPRASQRLGLPAQNSGIEVTSSSGEIELQVGRVRSLTVGSEQFRDITVVLSATEPTERIGDGLLPTVLFHALYVNNREGFVVFNPKLKNN